MLTDEEKQELAELEHLVPQMEAIAASLQKPFDDLDVQFAELEKANEAQVKAIEDDLDLAETKVLAMVEEEATAAANADLAAS